MPNYSQYEARDFAIDDSFCRWVLKNAPEEATFWHSWLEANPAKADHVAQARQLILTLHRAQESMSDVELHKHVQQEQKNRHREETPLVELRPHPMRQWIAIAAMIVATLGIGYLYIDRQQPDSTDLAIDLAASALGTTELVRIQNETQKPKEFKLPDGSLVTLQANSQLRFPKQFASGKRVVFLQGEAFFSIVRNPQKPFSVYTNELVTSVLGTSFTVRAYEQEATVQVVVKTGKVSVLAKTASTLEVNKSAVPESGLILTPNQQVVYNRQNKQLKRSLIAQPEAITKTDESTNLEFSHTPIKTVFQRLQQLYGIPILFDSEQLSGCELSANLNDELLFDQLSLICKAIGGEYEVIDGQIVIQAKGCS